MLDVRTKEHAHELLERMAPGQLSAVVDLMESLLDPVTRSLANAPWDDEAIDEEEEQAVAESKVWLAQNPSQGTSRPKMVGTEALQDWLRPEEDEAWASLQRQD